jgi:glycerophosphoryl diester phosphodiesterase
VHLSLAKLEINGGILGSMSYVETLTGQRPVVIAHRGASGYRPEHTLAAYEMAIAQGADFIEPDLVMTADGVLIARHDNILDFTTNVGDLPQFAGKKTTKNIDGSSHTGWFAEDFTHAEIKQLRARERRSGSVPTPFRPANCQFDDRWPVPTLVDVIKLARAGGVGIYPETKHPTHILQETGHDINQVLLNTLQLHGIRNFNDLPVYIQSFEVQNLQRLRREMKKRDMELRLVQLLADHGQPFDIAQVGGSTTYADMATSAGLASIAGYAHGVGPEKYHFILPKDEAGRLNLGEATSFVRDAHAARLLVHPYTFRGENRSLPTNFQGKRPQNELQLGNLVGEIQRFLQTGIDGFFTDHPDLGRQAE